MPPHDVSGRGLIMGVFGRRSFSTSCTHDTLVGRGQLAMSHKNDSAPKFRDKGPIARSIVPFTFTVRYGVRRNRHRDSSTQFFQYRREEERETRLQLQRAHHDGHKKQSREKAYAKRYLRIYYEEFPILQREQTGLAEFYKTQLEFE